MKHIGKLQAVDSSGPEALKCTEYSLCLLFWLGSNSSPLSYSNGTPNIFWN